MKEKTKINLPQETSLERQMMSEILGATNSYRCPCRTGGCAGVRNAIEQGYKDQLEKGQQ